jgi:hypothetical protein
MQENPDFEEISSLIKKEINKEVSKVKSQVQAEVNQVINTIQEDMLKLWKKNKLMAIAFIGIFAIILLAGFFF